MNILYYVDSSTLWDEFEQAAHCWFHIIFVSAKWPSIDHLQTVQLFVHPAAGKLLWLHRHGL